MGRLLDRIDALAIALPDRSTGRALLQASAKAIRTLKQEREDLQRQVRRLERRAKRLEAGCQHYAAVLDLQDEGKGGPEAEVARGLERLAN